MGRAVGVRRGRGRPVTVFASGQGAEIADTEALAAGVRGTRLFFEYDRVAPWAATDLAPPPRRPRREADRDADELLAVADHYGASRAVGISRGARAVIGALAEEPDRFERVALVLPPGGNAAGRYAPWLAARLADPIPPRPVEAELLVIGQRGDRVHPATLAEQWAQLLAARLEVFPTGGIFVRHAEWYHALLAEFMNA
jgi:pimeloyl-ACP methyl ester carboxylesterase